MVIVETNNGNSQGSLMSSNFSYINDAASMLSYELTLRLDESLEGEILKMRKEIAIQFGFRELQQQPGILIASFVAKEMMEETIIRWVQRICSIMPAFDLVLNNFGGFPQKSIYLRVQNSEWFGRMAQQLKIIDDYLQSNECPPAFLIKRPQLTIANDFLPSQYEKAMSAYSQRSFTAYCNVGEITMHKRTANGENVKTANNFYLQALC